jgi:hypothetical protein
MKSSELHCSMKKCNRPVIAGIVGARIFIDSA